MFAGRKSVVTIVVTMIVKTDAEKRRTTVNIVLLISVMKRGYK